MGRRLASPGALVALAALAAVALACHSHASADDCKAMRDHYLDLAVKETAGAAAFSAAQAAAVRDVERGLKRAEPSYRAVEDACATISRGDVSCALGAETTRAWEACVRRADAP